MMAVPTLNDGINLFCHIFPSRARTLPLEVRWPMLEGPNVIGCAMCNELNAMMWFDERQGMNGNRIDCACRQRPQLLHKLFETCLVAIKEERIV